MRWIALIVVLTALPLLVVAGVEGQRRSDSGDAWTLLAGKYDKNGDGKITPQEYPREAAKFDAFDRDGNGVLTRSDFRGGGRRRPAARRGGQSGNRIAEFLAAAADLDGDQAVTAGERKAFAASVAAPDGKRVDDEKLKKAVTGCLSGARARMRGRMVIRALDANRDGVILTTELEKVFARLDRNHDGVIAKGELPRRRQSVRPPETQLPRRGDPAPDFDLLYAGDKKGSVRLSGFAGKKPVALLFGSYT